MASLFLIPYLAGANQEENPTPSPPSPARIFRPDGTPSTVPEWVRAGEEIQRSLWLTNSADRPARFLFRFETSADGKAISTDEDTDSLAGHAAVLIPVSFHTPGSLTTRSSGLMRLLTVIDGCASTAEVPFRVYAPEPVPASIPVFDPAGSLSNLLGALECAASEPCLAGSPGPLVIGPDALQQTNAPLTNLVGSAIGGHRLLAFAQPEEWLLRHLEMRAVEPLAGAATSAVPRHAVLEGLFDETVAGPDFLLLPPGGSAPFGCPGETATKLHVRRLIAAPYPPGWRPLIETTGTPRASPLLEYAAARGTAVLFLLEPQDAAKGGPVLDRLLRRLLAHTAAGAVSGYAPPPAGRRPAPPALAPSGS